MTNPDSTANSPAPMSVAARVGWGAVIFMTLAVCYFGNLGAIGFVGPDEPRYTWIARDMAESGDWVTPRLYGKPWFEKPVLYYWMAGASFKLFGVSEAAARLPSAISALLATLALAWLAWRVYGAETARWLLLLLPTSVGMIGFSHAAAMDMPFSAMQTIAMACAAVALGLTQNQNTPILPRTPWIALLLFGFFLGLAVLAKGPAAIILCGGAVFFWALFTKRWRDVFRLLHPAAIFSFCATALPWYILCARRNPDFFRIFIIEHNFKRYLTPEFQHVQPFWYYVPVIIVALLPWSLIAAGATSGWWRGRFAFDTYDRTAFFLSWALFCFVFFSISKSKLPGYILPALPPLVLLVAMAVVSSRQFVIRMMTVASLGGGSIFVMVGLLLLTSLFHFPGKPVGALPYVAVLVVALGLANLLVGAALKTRSSTNVHTLLSLVALAPVLLPLVGVSFLINRSGISEASPKGVAVQLIREGIPRDRLRFLGLRRDAQYGLNFYLHREIKDWRDDPIQDGYVLAHGEYCPQMNTLLSCDDVWERPDFSDGTWALLRVKPIRSADGPASGGKPR